MDKFDDAEAEVKFGVKTSRLSISQRTLMGQTFEEDVRQIERAGLVGIGIQKHKVAAIGLKRARRVLRDASLIVTSYMSTGYFLDPGKAARSLADAQESIETAAELEAGCLAVIAGGVCTVSFEEATERTCDWLQKVAPLAHNCGVTLALEPVHPILRHLGHINTFRDAVEIVARVPSLKVIVDVWHLWWDWRFLADAQANVESIALIQMSDFDEQAIRERQLKRAPLGEGIMPLREYLEAIERAGYSGFYELELVPTEPVTDGASIIDANKRMFEEMCQDVR